MIKTEFFEDFVDYYRKAEILQNRNLGLSDKLTGDPLMDNVKIYDTVHRRHAGFSKALEDLHGVRFLKNLQRYKTIEGEISIYEFHYLHLLHRFTGSGASFQPRYLADGSLNPKEHGYCNNIVGEVAEIIKKEGIKGARNFIVNNKKPMVTSTGNQPPSLKNPDPTKYRLAQQYYFDQVAESFVADYVNYLLKDRERGIKGIKECVDFCCNWHKQRGFKQWHFVMTAFVMDTAEYYPNLVDPNSHCYYGANCIKSFDLIFDKDQTDPKSKAVYYENCMAELCRVVGGRPYDVEDVCCDYIRYHNEYIPKGYEHLDESMRYNDSILKVDMAPIGKIYPPKIQERLTRVLG